MGFNPAELKKGIYSITNTAIGMVYFGLTTCSFRRRWNLHRMDLRAGRHHNKKLQADWSLYGESAFAFVVVEVVEVVVNLRSLEASYISASTAPTYNAAVEFARGTGVPDFLKVSPTFGRLISRAGFTRVALAGAAGVSTRTIDALANPVAAGRQGYTRELTAWKIARAYAQATGQTEDTAFEQLFQELG